MFEQDARCPKCLADFVALVNEHGDCPRCGLGYYWSCETSDCDDGSIDHYDVLEWDPFG